MRAELLQAGLPIEPPPLAAPRLLHCRTCERPGGKALLGGGSIVEVRCHDGCKHTTTTLGPFPLPAEEPPPVVPIMRLLQHCAVVCQRCGRKMAKALLAPGSSYEGRCRSCKLLTTVVGPWPWPER